MAGSKKKSGRRRSAMGRSEMAVRNPIWMAMKGSPMDEQAVAKLVVDARMALHRVTAGECRDDDPDELALPINVAMVLAERQDGGAFVDFGAQYMPQIKDAQDAVMRAQLRANAGHSFAFSGPELAAVKLVLDLFEQQMQHIPHREVIRAMATCADRIRSGQVMCVGWAPGAAPTEQGC